MKPRRSYGEHLKEHAQVGRITDPNRIERLTNPVTSGKA